ncbi:helix-turn-helix transcriptional regulator [Rhodococcus sp. NPDC049939]|uniref:helix-turn-helix domain-containing protein n=1 Tax=Rhodococcus sp. NPDC049939 TaxID=3155511 RepID=UPI0033C9DBA8
MVAHSDKRENRVATFAEKFRYLIDNVHPKDRPPFTVSEIVDGIRSNGGTITQGYVSMLLNGLRPNPSLQVVQDIARFFHVPLDYFADDSSYADFQRYISWIRSLREDDVPTAARAYNPYLTGNQAAHSEQA